ncbi:glyoxylate/hydroxypyruvate reductase A [Ponticoccus sp. SC2-23]|uniref:2-hydroxyacid dehydrogenase n=1 Tax=Alexandriicola marinus TaxID=2081710 RepID=UPI000FD85D9F|nr:glyoxylate/hydroxypyruvate reductase A [Alexandriicola marinus]MBM1219731.1 glyoxylate/hydroxypyruvate reductase A [Ponticoccus sp. SC6-9]MBM1223197.1 glyoxylate/hydroxypyruvate reductase A [Ponticoccus sp. SC6-15]MBM1229544.1 glyoxylate/hydroxypyruvate reductase A [Ponticoccus sp. SC6-38]MBM1232163.1 glyoxylate/hydroxypyruvate reductase A [Ponticoccus sp. SC6-45]MBM1237887.1 glyoxylate/hydroxypyruvate reductase A [Ponticoccus sp. SC6-49]MBM1241174.1 glyoxylate/hydroxypyruvate reductase A 
MAIKVLFSAPDGQFARYRAPLSQAFEAAGLTVDLAEDHAPEETDFIVFAPGGQVSDFRPFTRTRAVMGLWAGVESIVTNRTLTQPLARMVDHGMTRGMVEYVAGHALRYHIGMDGHIVNPDHEWAHRTTPLAADRPVTILGLGALGAACAETLAQLGFPVTGWSRSPKTLDNVTCLSGQDGLHRALEGAQIVVLLVPLTAETENVLDAAALARLAPGAFVINPGRGALIDDDALLEALGSGRVAHATLDVFRTEPLPADHPYWSHPRVTVTPHVASETRPVTAARVIAENVRRAEAGEPLLHLVDRDRGY